MGYIFKNILSKNKPKNRSFERDSHVRFKREIITESLPYSSPSHKLYSSPSHRPYSSPSKWSDSERAQRRISVGSEETIPPPFNEEHINDDVLNVVTEEILG